MYHTAVLSFLVHNVFYLFSENLANVAYQEFDFPSNFDFHLMKYIPNIYFGSWPEGERYPSILVFLIHILQCTGLLAHRLYIVNESDGFHSVNGI